MTLNDENRKIESTIGCFRFCMAESIKKAAILAVPALYCLVLSVGFYSKMLSHILTPKGDEAGVAFLVCVALTAAFGIPSAMCARSAVRDWKDMRILKGRIAK